MIATPFTFLGLCLIVLIFKIAVILPTFRSKHIFVQLSTQLGEKFSSTGVKITQNDQQFSRKCLPAESGIIDAMNFFYVVGEI